MAKVASGKKKAKVYYERLVGKDHVKVARAQTKRQRKGF